MLASSIRWPRISIVTALIGNIAKCSAGDFQFDQVADSTRFDIRGTRVRRLRQRFCLLPGSCDRPFAVAVPGSAGRIVCFGG